jgi:integrase
MGNYDGANPVEDTAIPPAPKRGITYAYSLEEVTAMLLALPEPARTIVAAAAFLGLRRGEIQGLRWEDFHDGAIYVQRSMWESHITEPKTRASKAPVPVISPLVAMLEQHRRGLGNPKVGVMFPSGNGEPLSLNNVLTRQIKAVLDCCHCGKGKMEHSADHEFRRDASLPVWRGWHGFRRGLATNLNRLGVQDKTIQAILRHSNLATTMNVYVQSVGADTVTAMRTL